MSNFLSRLTASERARLLEELNYMNLEEIRGFCSKHGIPYRIMAESADGKVKATKDTDRKPIVLARVRRYLTTGQVGQPTRIPAQIVREESPPARPGPRDRLYYRWYAKEFEGVMRLLRDLTAGRFKDGAVARVLAMEFWTRGEAPSLEEREERPYRHAERKSRNDVALQRQRRKFNLKTCQLMKQWLDFPLVPALDVLAR